MFTIGMACHDDFHGVAFSIESLVVNRELDGCEIIVVDNNPTSAHGQETAKFCADLASVVRYIPMAEKTGTTQSRERIFSEARGSAVLAMDCHVLFPTGTIGRLKQWYASNPECSDLYSGPLILNHGQGYHTQFNDEWRGGMWGTWGSAWTCTCRSAKHQPLQFTTLEVGSQVSYRDLASSQQTVERCACGRTLPPHAWPQHERALLRDGFQPLGFSDGDPPFEIPGQGLGVFTCRKAAWLGFNTHFRGFGGEEMYIHTKYRQAGRKAICLPWLKWWHRFANPDGRRYPLTNHLKVRNYVLGHLELGLPLDPVHEHFVATDAATPDGEGPALSQAQWDFLVADPVGRVQPDAAAQVSVSFETGRVQPPAGAQLDEIFTWCQGVPRDLDQHLEKLRELAGQCEHVTEITKRRESTIGLAAGRPATLVSYQREPDLLLKTLAEAIVADAQGRDGQRRVAQHVTHWGGDSAAMNTIEETDLLYIDSVMSGERLKLELDQHLGKVRRFLVVRGTGAFGEQAEGSQSPGLFHALRPLVKADPAWRVIYHATNEYGITVLSRQPADYPPQPVHAWPPGFGPGTELKKIFADDLKITMPANCSCNALMVQMDVSGPAGCRASREQLVARIKENQAQWGWTERLGNVARAGVKALASGLAFKISWTDPIPGLVDAAIRRAEVEEARS